MRQGATIGHESRKQLWHYCRLFIVYGSFVLGSGIGCANPALQEYFPKGEYAESRNLTVVEGNGEILSVEEPEAIPGTQWGYAIYMAEMGLLGPGGIQQMMDGYGAKGWEIIEILNPASEGSSSTWLLFFFKKPLEEVID